ncbi:MAG: permease [Lachnospiraceae bacterium]|nr:permease [Lachnospiraceae bacterium]
MKRGKALFKRYRIFLFLLLLNAALLLFAPDLGKASFATSFDNLREMLSIIPPIFLLLGLMDVWIPRETMMKYMGNGSGVKGSVLAFLAGSFAAGPLYAAFPVAGIFLKKGVSLRNVFVFLGAWSTTKLPMMLFEITQLGGRFAAIRFCMNVAGILILALVMERSTGEETAAEIYRAAEEMAEGGPGGGTH